MIRPTIRSRGTALGALLALGMVLAACSSAATPAPTVAPTAAPTAPAASASAGASPAGVVTVNMATTSLGTVLTGPNGLSLYTHTGDTATTSTCTGSCATAWPPLTVAAGSNATAGTGVMGTLATLTRGDGSTQVTYDGLPLYGWQGDAKPGDVTGQGIAGFSVALVSGAAPSASPSGVSGY